MTRRQADNPEKARGGEHGNARLHRADVEAILKRYAAGESMTAIAADYKVGYTAIQKVVRGERWQHLEVKRPERRRFRQWTDTELRYLTEHPDQSNAEVAAALKRSVSSVTVQRSRQRKETRSAT